MCLLISSLPGKALRTLVKLFSDQSTPASVNAIEDYSCIKPDSNQTSN